MKLKLVKYLSPFNNEKNIAACNFLTIGKEYIALGISLTDAPAIYFEDDDGQPGYTDIHAFTITSNHIPTSWVISVDYRFESGIRGMYPKAWLETDDFWERLIEKEDPEIVQLYQQERDRIYAEEP